MSSNKIGAIKSLLEMFFASLECDEYNVEVFDGKVYAMGFTNSGTLCRIEAKEDFVFCIDFITFMSLIKYFKDRSGKGEIIVFRGTKKELEELEEYKKEIEEEFKKIDIEKLSFKEV